MTHAATPRSALEPRTDSSVVDSLSHPQAEAIRAVLTRKRGSAGDLILVDDAENIVQALRAGLVIRSVFRSDDVSLCSGMQQRLAAGVRHYTVARRTGKKLFGNDRISRIFALAEAPAASSLDAILPVRRDIAVLDGIGISGNVGAIIRTCCAMGVGAVVIVNAEGVDIFDRRVIRASRGYVFALPVIGTTPGELVALCAAQSVPLVVAEPCAGTAISALSSNARPLAIVYGGEKRGPSHELIAAAALRVRIPMSGAVESLNVAAAAAITLYCRQGFNQAGS